MASVAFKHSCSRPNEDILQESSRKILHNFIILSLSNWKSIKLLSLFTLKTWLNPCFEIFLLLLLCKDIRFIICYIYKLCSYLLGSLFWISAQLIQMPGGNSGFWDWGGIHHCKVYEWMLKIRYPLSLFIPIWVKEGSITLPWNLLPSFCNYNPTLISWSPKAIGHR